MIHTVKGFGIVNKAEIDDFLELSCFFDDPADVGNFIVIENKNLTPPCGNSCALYAGQEATVRTGHGTTDWFQIGKGVCQGCILSPAYLTYLQSIS